MHTPDRKTVALRTVALFEAAKGIIVLLLGLGLLRLVHKNLDEFAENLIRFLHVSPAGHLSNLFVTAAERFRDKNVWVLVSAAVIYALVRFTEAFGLWHDREWAEWFALLTGAMYLPLEVFSIMKHSHPVKWMVFIMNLLIVFYMLVLRIQATRHRGSARGAR
jgi:uncharacterized membrane protein (DUF2068 family)